MEVSRHVAIAVVRNGHRLLAVEGVHSVDGEIFLRPPGGGVELGETPEQALLREIGEELGLEITDVRFLGTLDNEFVFEGVAQREINHVFEITFADPEAYRRDALPFFEASGAAELATWEPISSEERPPDRALYPSGLEELLRDT